MPVLFYDAVNDWFEIGDLRGHNFWPAEGKAVPREYVTHWCPLVRPAMSDQERAKIPKIQ